MRPAKYFFIVFTFAIFLSNCSSKRIEQNFIDSLAGKFSSNQSNVIRGEEDPELLGDSMPFMLKMLEIMSESSPENEDIKVSLAQGFTAYGSLWLENEALINEDENYEYSEHLNNRAKQLFYRAWHYGFQGLNLQYPAFREKIKNDLSVLTSMKKNDVPLLTWTGLAMVSWIKHSSDNADAISELPLAVSMIKRAFDLNPEYGDGILYEFFIYYDSERIDSGGKKNLLANYRDKIITDSDNHKCSPYLTWASAISVKTQNRSEFIEMLEEGLKIDVDKRPEYRLSNKICQKMSGWYLSKIDDFFL